MMKKHKAIGEEAARLLVARFIMEINHPVWVANPVLVEKKNRTCMMCVDFIGLNKACPMDPFPL